MPLKILVALLTRSYEDNEEQRQERRQRRNWWLNCNSNYRRYEEIEIGYPPELLEEILRDEIPNCILEMLMLIELPKLIRNIVTTMPLMLYHMNYSDFIRKCEELLDLSDVVFWR